MASINLWLFKLLSMGWMYEQMPLENIHLSSRPLMSHSSLSYIKIKKNELTFSWNLLFLLSHCYCLFIKSLCYSCSNVFGCFILMFTFREDIFISYSVFQNALEKFRSCIVENYAQVIPLVFQSCFFSFHKLLTINTL